MKSKLLVIIFTALALSAVLVFFQHTHSQAQNSSFASFIPVNGGQGSIRFFDTASGKLYTYDRSLQKVIRIVQIEEMGEPATQIYSHELDGESRYTNPREQ